MVLSTGSAEHVTSSTLFSSHFNAVSARPRGQCQCSGRRCPACGASSGGSTAVGISDHGDGTRFAGQSCGSAGIDGAEPGEEAGSDAELAVGAGLSGAAAAGAATGGAAALGGASTAVGGGAIVIVGGDEFSWLSMGAGELIAVGAAAGDDGGRAVDGVDTDSEPAGRGTGTAPRPAVIS